jgi:hypothetical protein
MVRDNFLSPHSPREYKNLHFLGLPRENEAICGAYQVGTVVAELGARHY